MSIFEDDRDLLDRFRRGDRAALAEVYERYVDDVAVLVRRGFTMEAQGHLVVPGAGDRDAELELVQETFLRAFAGSARLAFDGVRPYRPYLLRIAKNLMIDRLRVRQREAGAAVGGIGDIDQILAKNAAFSPEVDPDPAADLSWRQLLATTGDFLAGLDQESRDFVRLRFEEGLSQDQVAGRLATSRRRVRTLEERVQKGLKRHLQRLGLLDR